MLSSMRAQIFQPIWSTDKQTLTAQTSDYSNAQAVSYCTCITSSSYRVQCYTRTVFVSPPFLCVFPIYYSSYYAFFHFDYNKGFLFYFSTYPYKTISLHKISITLKHLWFLLLLVFFSHPNSLSPFFPQGAGCLPASCRERQQDVFCHHRPVEDQQHVSLQSSFFSSPLPKGSSS